MKKFSCGIILCCVAAIALAGCPNANDYMWVGPRSCRDGEEVPTAGQAKVNPPKVKCKWMGPNDCDGCNRFKALSYGQGYECRELKNGVIGDIADSSYCRREDGDQPSYCVLYWYKSPVKCKEFSYKQSVCESRGCKYKYTGTLDPSTLL